MGRDRGRQRAMTIASRFQSTRPVWGATQAYQPRYAPISISIHAPRMGRDASASIGSKSSMEFQSTRPVWGATPHPSSAGRLAIFQSTRPVWGATTCRRAHRLPRRRFQSTRPVWGATGRGHRHPPRLDISIHAPRMGRDYLIRPAPAV